VIPSMRRRGSTCRGRWAMMRVPDLRRRIERLVGETAVVNLLVGRLTQGRGIPGYEQPSRTTQIVAPTYARNHGVAVILGRRLLKKQQPTLGSTRHEADQQLPKADTGSAASSRASRLGWTRPGRPPGASERSSTRITAGSAGAEGMVPTSPPAPQVTTPAPSRLPCRPRPKIVWTWWSTRTNPTRQGPSGVGVAGTVPRCSVSFCPPGPPPHAPRLGRVGRGADSRQASWVRLVGARRAPRRAIRARARSSTGTPFEVVSVEAAGRSSELTPPPRIASWLYPGDDNAQNLGEPVRRHL